MRAQETLEKKIIEKILKTGEMTVKISYITLTAQKDLVARLIQYARVYRV